MAKYYIHEIPEGYEARIEGNKVIIELAESEDERIRKEIIDHLVREVGLYPGVDRKEHKWLRWLEKQKYPNEDYLNNPAFLDGFDTGREVQKIFDEQKPIDPSDDELQRHQDELYDFKVFAAKQAKEHHISFVHDFEWDAFCGEILSYFNEQKPQGVYVDCTEHPEWYGMPPKEQKPVEYLDKDKVYAIMTKLTNLSYSQLIPINSDEYKKIHEITSDVRSLLDYSIEQKPAEWSDEDEKMRQGCIDSVEYELLDNGRDDEVETDPRIVWLKSLPLNLKKKNEDVAKLCSNEWSEGDEEMLVRLLDSISIGNDYKEMRNWLLPKLRSLYPQPNKEIYQAAKHDLAIKFMNYLDENRTEGKMSLSNGECEDIDKAFKENDWAKIIRYYEKYERRD